MPFCSLFHCMKCVYHELMYRAEAVVQTEIKKRNSDRIQAKLICQTPYGFPLSQHQHVVFINRENVFKHAYISIIIGTGYGKWKFINMHNVAKP